MEQQCGCECLRNGDVVNEDRISELDEDLLVHIISSLPTKSAVATSVLSRRWRHVWKTVQNLKFVSIKYHRTFTEDVYKFFLLHKAPFLESLHLEIRDRYGASNVGILLVIAFARHVRNLVLDYVGSLFCFPSVFCIDNNTLESLELKNSVILDFPSRACLKSLRKLHLYKIHVHNEDSFCNLLCGCPNLEDLVLHGGETYLGTVTIAVPSLQRLTIDKENNYGGGEGYVINAPALKYLNINGLFYFEYFLIEKAPKLEEAKVSDVSKIDNENIMESLTSAKRLSLQLSPFEIKFPSGSIFHQLVYLDLHTNNRKWWNLLSFMLNASPKLQILKLTDLDMSSNKGNRIGQKWNQPKCVPECLLFNLETFVWIGHEWQRKDEKEIATYILRNTRRLKKATFSTKPIEPEKLKKLEKRRRMLDELANVDRASNSCHFVFESM
ncbi:PREDICTED: putative F-box/FBD/LRR-repeat protein At3g49040 isoform X1 [Camelina sativa]|uniref:F-box/FBD/LRR-repeat protein At3g49040 isoform X1 n=1 Tax=Camelina sativa TaxID=90675 RepID=A0ABM1RLQ2_CAMSA|nr:PREDICTED: putative F-box/FBD/LRR-repeat protein At3g49040 isoform X1 [Camelina sativa]